MRKNLSERGSNLTTKEVKSVRWLAELLDNRYRVPGTDITFGLDVIIGFVPGLGDIITFSISGGLILAMIKNGASSKAVTLMLLNIVADSSIGSIPIVGDIFDVFFKANKRNVDLYEEHFVEGRHQGSVWPLLIGVLIVLILLFIALLYAIANFLQWFYHFIF